MVGSSPSLLCKDGLNAPEEGNQHSRFFSPSPNRQVDGSPLPMTIDTLEHGVEPASLFSSIHKALSAPAELGTLHEKMVMEPSSARHDTDHRLLFPPVYAMSESFELDPMAPMRAIRSKLGTDRESAAGLVALGDGDLRGREEGMGGGAEDGEKSRGRGGSFKIQWLSTEKVSFQKTKNIRNPWNHDREVKVSRDGTELEPGVGHRLIEQWAALAKKR
ncbi:hypothetical protein C0993_002196 [Termitomyces sp. T159_Od127]|nr:hypothetical protein C0993_002196 [Termitomyces sp. T159_Od127]